MKYHGILRILCCVVIAALCMGAFGCSGSNSLDEEFISQFVCDMVALEYRANADAKVEQYAPNLNETVKANLDGLVENTWREFNEVFEGNPPGATCTVTNIIKNTEGSTDRWLVEAHFVSATLETRTVIIMAQVTVSGNLISDWRYECYDTNPTAFDPWAL